MKHLGKLTESFENNRFSFPRISQFLGFRPYLAAYTDITPLYSIAQLQSVSMVAAP